MVKEFCSALNGLYETHMKVLRTPRCITHLNMRAIDSMRARIFGIQ